MLYTKNDILAMFNITISQLNKECRIIKPKTIIVKLQDDTEISSKAICLEPDFIKYLKTKYNKNECWS